MQRSLSYTLLRLRVLRSLGPGFACARGVLELGTGRHLVGLLLCEVERGRTLELDHAGMAEIEPAETKGEADVVFAHKDSVHDLISHASQDRVHEVRCLAASFGKLCGREDRQLLVK